MEPPEHRGIAAPAGLAGDPAFEEPWQAKAFAITVLLHERGLFAWTEWADVLSRHCAGLHPSAGNAASSGDAGAYYSAWMRALEEIVSAKGLASPALIEDTAEAWQRAAHATPHGQPIELKNGRAEATDSGRH